MIERTVKGINIRRVTPDSLEEDLALGRLHLHPNVVEHLPPMLGSGAVDFFVAEDLQGKSCGQIAIDWDRPKIPEVRERLGLEKDERAPGLGFLEVPEPSRGQGIGGLLLRAACSEVRNLHNQAYVVVDVNNTGAQRFFANNGFAYIDYFLDGELFPPNPDGTFSERGTPTTMTFMAADLTQLPE